MLYVTTRNKIDSYTDYRTLYEDRSPNGGFYIPLQVPKLDRRQLNALKSYSFGETISFILNLFYKGRITPWDVDCCIGRDPLKLICVSHKVILAKLWDNPQGEYGYICRMLYEKLCNKNRNVLTHWANIAIRISVLFGIFGALQKNNSNSFDLCINCGDFSDPFAVWYAKCMGLPVGKLICTCNEDECVWDFFRKGEFNTALTASNSKSAGIEMLIYGILGLEETKKYLEISEQKGIYRISDEQVRFLNESLFVSFVGQNRQESLIGAFFTANNLIIDPNTALLYGGVQDYRAKTGNITPSVLLWDYSPVLFHSVIERVTSLDKREIEKHVNNY